MCELVSDPNYKPKLKAVPVLPHYPPTIVRLTVISPRLGMFQRCIPVDMPGDMELEAIQRASDELHFELLRWHQPERKPAIVECLEQAGILMAAAAGKKREGKKKGNNHQKYLYENLKYF